MIAVCSFCHVELDTTSSAAAEHVMQHPARGSYAERKQRRERRARRAFKYDPASA